MISARRRAFIGALVASAAPGVLPAEAQQKDKTLPRVAVVFLSIPTADMSGADPPSP